MLHALCSHCSATNCTASMKTVRKQKTDSYHPPSRTRVSLLIMPISMKIRWHYVQGLSRQQIYETLVLLTKRHILHYIPGKKTPYIIYTRERQETRTDLSDPDVYEDRKESYMQRIKSMLEYAEANQQMPEPYTVTAISAKRTNTTADSVMCVCKVMIRA